MIFAMVSLNARIRLNSTEGCHREVAAALRRLADVYEEHRGPETIVHESGGLSAAITTDAVLEQFSDGREGSFYIEQEGRA